jgi:RHS repeat-associated protein
MPRQLRVEFPGAIYHLMSRGYTSDPAWNLTKTTNNTFLVTTRTVNNLNQITASGGNYTYDANGNRTYASGNYSTYIYDDDHNSRSERLLWGNKLVAGLGSHYQLTSRNNNPAWYSGSTKTDFTYDGKGRLRRRIEYSWNSTYSTWSQASDTRYIYSGMLAIQERNGSNVPEVSYTRGWDLSGSLEGAGGIGGLLARSRSYSAGAWGNHDFYHADGNGNITMMLDSSQATVATYKYDPYGNSFTASGALASANLYRFSSKLWCANAGLYYYGYRFYDPLLQRWLNQDPIEEEGGLNLYSFAQNNPISQMDAYGLQIVDRNAPPNLNRTVPTPGGMTNITNPNAGNPFGGGALGSDKSGGASGLLSGGNRQVQYGPRPKNPCSAAQVGQKRIKGNKKKDIECPCSGPTTVNCVLFDECVPQQGLGWEGTSSSIVTYYEWKPGEDCEKCPEN